MAIYNDLRWTNPNTGPVTTTIYRDTKTISSGALPEPLVSFTDDTTTYQDKTVVLGTTYFYVIGFTNEKGQSVFSRNFEYTSKYSLGPGDSEIIYGNQLYGYLGPATMPFTLSEFYQAINYPSSGASLTTTQKIMVDNKIYFVTGNLMAVNSNLELYLTTGLEIELYGRRYNVKVAKNYNELCLCRFGLNNFMKDNILGSLGTVVDFYAFRLVQEQKEGKYVAYNDLKEELLLDISEIGKDGKIQYNLTLELL